MWCGIMKEFKCKVISTRSCCGRDKEMAFTLRQFGKGGKGKTAQLDYIVGPRRTSDEAQKHNDVKTWDHYANYVVSSGKGGFELLLSTTEMMKQNWNSRRQ